MVWPVPKVDPTPGHDNANIFLLIPGVIIMVKCEIWNPPETPPKPSKNILQKSGHNAGCEFGIIAKSSHYELPP